MVFVRKVEMFGFCWQSRKTAARIQDEGLWRTPSVQKRHVLTLTK